MLPDLQPRHLQNEWVVLVPLEEHHYDALFAAAADPKVWEQHPNPDRYKPEVFRTYFEGAMSSGGAFLIRSAIDDAVIGSSRFYDYEAELSCIKIGYTFFACHCWGKGFNRATKHLMLEHAFGFVSKVLFQVGENNLRSRKAMERIGAICTGKESVAYYGEPPKLNCVYEISKIDFKGLC